MNDSDELLDVFREEAQELLDKIASLTRGLLSAPSDKLNEHLQTLSMAAHNLKGAAFTVGLADIVNISHAIEDILDRIKEDNTELTAETVDNVLDAITVMHLSLAGENVRDRMRSLLPQLGGETLEESQGVKAVLQPDLETSKITTERIEHIRIDTSRFDRLMGFAGVLLESEARMEARNTRWNKFVKDIQKQIQQDKEKAELLSPFLYEAKYLLQKDRNDLLEFDHLVQEISGAMKLMRMVPLKNAETLWRKTVREAAHLSHKQVELQIDVGGIELDKQVLEQLRDPFMHILRNAVGHGIEDTNTRVAKGKPSQGQIQIRAQVRGARLQFEISDDGKGIDLEEVYQSAIAKGLFNETEKKDQAQIMDVLFFPGFSTAKDVSALSGRGVGLDVVRSHVESLGGNVAIDHFPTLGGATFRLAVPLSILSSFGLLVRLDQTIYALGLEHVSRTMRVSTKDIEYVDGKPLVPQGDTHPLRLAWLSDIIGTKPSTNKDMLQVAILQRSDIQMALVVDEIIGQREFVMQALPWNFIEIPGVNGAVIQADGSVAISLDVPFLFESARSSGRSLEAPRRSIPEGVVRNVLVVDDSMASLTLGRNFLEGAGYIVSTAVDGVQAWEKLKERKFDLVVSDVNMPNMDGLELTKRIRQSSKYKSIPVILITSRAKPQDIMAGTDAGADEYVIKGTFDQQTLIELVAKYL